MPTRLAPNMIVQAIFACRKQSQVALNILHYRITSVTDNSITDLELATDLSGGSAPAFTAILVSTAKFEGVQVQIIQPALYPAEHSISGAAVGLVGGDALPKQVTGITTKLAAFAGRSNRGRIYWPFPSGNDNDTDDTPTNDYVSRIQDLANGLRFAGTITGGSGTADIQPVIFQRAGGTRVDWDSNLSRKKWATQRRRGDYGRPNALPWED